MLPDKPHPVPPGDRFLCKVRENETCGRAGGLPEGPYPAAVQRRYQHSRGAALPAGPVDKDPQLNLVGEPFKAGALTDARTENQHEKYNDQPHNNDYPSESESKQVSM